MNDIRRTILWVIFGFSLVLLWDQWQVYNGHRPTFLPSAKTAATDHANAPTTPAAPTSGTSPAASSTNASVPQQTAAPAIGERVTVTTDVFKATIDGEGGTLSELQLLNFVDQTNNHGLVELFRRLVGLPVAENESHPVTLMENGSPATQCAAACT